MRRAFKRSYSLSLVYLPPFDCTYYTATLVFVGLIHFPSLVTELALVIARLLNRIPKVQHIVSSLCLAIHYTGRYSCM
jgi:uncharacterized membrane protein